MCFLFEMKFLQGKNYIPFIIYIFTRTQTCIEQCLINIRSDFAGVTFLSINFNLIGLRFTISPPETLHLHYITTYHHIIHFIWSFIHPSIYPAIYIQTGFLQFSPWKTFSVGKRKYFKPCGPQGLCRRYTILPEIKAAKIIHKGRSVAGFQ